MADSTLQPLLPDAQRKSRPLGATSPGANGHPSGGAERPIKSVAAQPPVEYFSSYGQAAAAQRLRDACCDVLRAALGPPVAAASVPLVTRLLALEALADGVTALDSAAAAKSSPVLSLFKQCLTSVQTAVKDAEGSSTVPLDVATARGWRYEVFPTYPHVSDCAGRFDLEMVLRGSDFRCCFVGNRAHEKNLAVFL